MTRKPQEDLFSSTALALPAYTPSSSLVPLERSRELVKAERKVSEEAHKQRLVIAEQQGKTSVAIAAQAQIRVAAAQAFVSCAESIWEIQKSPGRDPGLQVYVDQFADHTLRAAGTHILAATNIGASRINAEVDRPLYVSTEEERRGLLARLRG